MKLTTTNVLVLSDCVGTASDRASRQRTNNVVRSPRPSAASTFGYPVVVLPLCDGDDAVAPVVEVGDDSTGDLGTFVGHPQLDHRLPMVLRLEVMHLGVGHRAALGAQRHHAVVRQQREVVGIHRDEVALRRHVPAHDRGHAFTQQIAHCRGTHRCVSRLTRLVPEVRDIVHQAGHVELGVVGAARVRAGPRTAVRGRARCRHRHRSTARSRADRGVRAARRRSGRCAGSPSFSPGLSARSVNRCAPTRDPRRYTT